MTGALRDKSKTGSKQHICGGGMDIFLKHTFTPTEYGGGMNFIDYQ